MNKETYESLKEVIKFVRGGKKLKNNDITAVESWIDEVAKENEWQCKNKDKNGNACWNCEMGNSEDCGLSKGE